MKKCNLFIILILSGMLFLSNSMADSVHYDIERMILTVECEHAVPGSAVSFLSVFGNEDSYSVSPETIHYLRQLKADANGNIIISFIGDLMEDYVFLTGGSTQGSLLHVIGSYSIANEDALRLPSGLTAIEEEAFMGDESLTIVVIGQTLTTIDHRAFMNCQNLIYIEIPASVTSIAEDAFNGCEGVIIGCTEDSEAFLYAEEHHLTVRLLNR